jgi:hypothetical protein
MMRRLKPPSDGISSTRSGGSSLHHRNPQYEEGRKGLVTPLVRIQFRLDPDEDGYPPVTVEVLNASPQADGLFRLDNAPFFTRDVSYGDLVRATPSEVSGQYEFESVVSESAFTSISIILLDREMDELLMNLFRGCQCILEFGEFGKLRMLAVAIPASADYAVLRAKLTGYEAQEKLSFAELAVPRS